MVVSPPSPRAAAIVAASPPQPAGSLSFAELYDAHFAFVWRTVRRLGTPEAYVDDVAQEVFLVIHRRCPELEDRGAIKSWIFSVVRNVVRGHRRVLLRKNPHALRSEASADAEDVRDAKAEGEIARREAGRLVSLLLEELDDDKREVFVLAELEQMTGPEIALAIGVPTNTVSSRLRGARLEFAAAAARHRARDEWRSR
jgi:RNA polymerase sigma-70 factor, ECF subfamily